VKAAAMPDVTQIVLALIETIHLIMNILETRRARRNR
jgi:hypothetical protein